MRAINVNLVDGPSGPLVVIEQKDTPPEGEPTVLAVAVPLPTALAVARATVKAVEKALGAPIDFYGEV